MENNLKQVIKILLAIFLIILAIKFFIFILPIIIILLLGYLIYQKFKRGNNDISKKEKDSNQGKIIEGTIVKEKVDD